tara:strand:+ start:1160 stop:1582 length:423 start_codon:yes stop_codon:yes gene_type:complete
MSELGLQRLQSLGFQFWSLRKVNKKTLKNKEKEVFFLLGENILIAGNLNEFNKYLRFVPSITRVLEIAAVDTKEINRDKALEKDFLFIIDFIQDLPFKSKKTLKFDSLKLLINDVKLKKYLYSELKQLIQENDPDFLSPL